MNKLHIYKMGNVVGIVVVAFSAVCMVWGVLLTNPVLKELHANLLLLSFPGFSFTAIGVIIGLVEAYIYGWLLGALFAWLCRKICVTGK